MDFFPVCPSDRSKDASLGGCENDLSATIQVEQILFSIAPAVIFISLNAWRILGSVDRPMSSRVGRPGLKLVSCLTSRWVLGYEESHLPGYQVSVAIYAGLRLVLLILSVANGENSAYVVSSSTFTFGAALCLAASWCWEYSRSLPPSRLITVYLAISLSLDGVQSYTLWLASTTDDESNFLRWTAVAMASKFVVLFVGPGGTVVGQGTCDSSRP